jgi:ankyrin repeat protein
MCNAISYRLHDAQNEMTALMRAAQKRNRADVAMLLCERGADVNKQNQVRMHVLHLSFSDHRVSVQDDRPHACC